MKKLYQEPYQKRRNHVHAEKSWMRKLSYKDWVKSKNQENQGKSKARLKVVNLERKLFSSYEKVYAPREFSFTQNPVEVVDFISNLEGLFKKKRRVYVKMNDVQTIDYGAIVVLLSIMVKFKSSNIPFNGNFPDDEVANTIVRKSGFVDKVNHRFKEMERYSIGRFVSDGIHTHAWKNVDSELSSQIIMSSSETIWGESRRCQGVQRVLIELMMNTNNHAVFDKKGEKHWWLSVSHDPENRKVVFSFVDFGVGIFESLQNKKKGSKFYNCINIMKRAVCFETNADLLRLILEGKMHKTVTGKPYRGKGLPGIAQVMRRNQISNLYIISNDVFCDVSKDVFQKLSRSFSGTFVSWEVGEENESQK